VDSPYITRRHRLMPGCWLDCMALLTTTESPVERLIELVFSCSKTLRALLSFLGFQPNSKN
jgi:hypothetical protein